MKCGDSQTYSTNSTYRIETFQLTRIILEILATIHIKEFKFDFLSFAAVRFFFIKSVCWTLSLGWI